MHGDLAGEDDLLEGARADPLHRARDGGLVVLGRRGRGDDEAAGGRRVEQRERALAQLGEAALDPGDELVGHVVGLGEDAHGEPDVAAAAGERQLGDDQVGGAEAAPVRRARAVGREGEAAQGDQAGAGRAVRDVADRGPGQPAPGGGDGGEAVAAAALEPRDAAERGDRGAVAVGLLQAGPGVVGAPRGEHDGGRVDLRADPHREAGGDAPAGAPRSPHRALAALQQLCAGRAVQRQPAISGPRPHAG